MSNLICATVKGIEIVINPDTGEKFITIAGYSRLTGLNNSTIRQRCRRMIVRQKSALKPGEAKIAAKPFCWSDALESVERDTGRGVFRTLLIPLEKIAIWVKKDNPSLAQEIEKLFGATLDKV